MFSKQEKKPERKRFKSEFLLISRNHIYLVKGRLKITMADETEEPEPTDCKKYNFASYIRS